MPKQTLEGHHNEVKCVAFSTSGLLDFLIFKLNFSPLISGNFVATCSRDKTLWFWQKDEDDELQCSSVQVFLNFKMIFYLSHKNIILFFRQHLMAT